MSGNSEEDRRERLAALPNSLREGMDRRTFLRTVVNAGYALGMAQFLGVDDFLAAEDGTVPVVTALARRDPADPWSIEERTRSVPVEWYTAVTKAFELHATIADAGLTGYLGSAVKPGDYRDATAAISVDASAADVEETNAELDGLVDGIGLEVQPIEGVQELEEEDENATPATGDALQVDSLVSGGIPGGVRCENEHSVATLAPALHHPDEERSYFTTAHHAFGEFDDPVGASLYLPYGDGDSIEIGRVRHSFANEDVVAAEPVDDYRPASEIYSAAPHRVVGQFTRLGLADLAARGEPLEKVSAETGHAEGEIKGVDAVTCYTADYCRRGQLKWGDEGDFTDGDSGSVSYHPDPRAPDENLLVAGFNNARTWWPGQNYIWGTAAYRLTDEHGYHF